MKRMTHCQLKLSLVSGAVFLALTASNVEAATPEPKAQKLATFSAQQIKNAVSDLGVEIPDEYFKYQVSLYRLTYQTIDGYDKPVIASGLVAVPNKGAMVASPVLSFQHGTIFQDKEAPTKDLSAGAPPAILASLGYITVASDYVGYGASRGKPHPYLLKTPSARAVTDFIKHSKNWLTRNNFKLNKQLFLTGYSEGGYATMAAHQAIQQAPIKGLDLTLSMPAAGPYHISRTLKSITSLAVTKSEATKLSPVLVDWLTKQIMQQLVPANSDVVFQDTIIRNYLRHGSSGVSSHDVYSWKASAPVVLFHGKKDATVPFFNATDAVAAMASKGSSNVTLIECSATPADHEGCVPEYGKLLVQSLGNYAQDL